MRHFTNGELTLLDECFKSASSMLSPPLAANRCIAFNHGTTARAQFGVRAHNYTPTITNSVIPRIHYKLDFFFYKIEQTLPPNNYISI